jgi:hypothetical protein
MAVRIGDRLQAIEQQRNVAFEGAGTRFDELAGLND